MEPLTEEERYIVKLDMFEGPLDLLLHLIRTHELDIFDIPIAFITKKYLEFINLMKEFNLDLASEYLEMAATLAYIKSRMLLPTEPDLDEELLEEGPDPREELIRRLLEYQKYKTAAEKLAIRPMLGRDMFPRGDVENVSVERDLASPGLFALMEAFQKVLKNADVDPSHEVSVTRISVSARINQLIDLMRLKQRLTFKELFEDQRTRADMVVTFLSLLEMTKIGLTKIHQVDIQSEIHLIASSSIGDTEKMPADQLLEEE
ncbi:MAG: segregation/condensation protein A [Deltaproteobacteria bacterium]|nr:segregation/condensation protein A [Deltaproteobacteria bacterium]